MDNAQRIVQDTQEQAVASWINYLNQQRLDELIERLDQQDINLKDALNELAELKAFIGDPEHILGSAMTKHGEIAEHMQVNISNARRAVEGLEKNHTFDGVGRTAPEDYLRNGNMVQSKFYNGLKQTFFNNHGLADHLKTYPDFVKNGGQYDIPKDQYDKLADLLKKYNNKDLRSQLSSSEFQLAKRLQTFLDENNLKLGRDVCPAVVNYDNVQSGVANKTVDNEEKNIKQKDKEIRKKAYEESKPTLKEGAKATGISAAIEGGVTFCISVAKKRKEKNFSEFTEDEWKEIGIDSGKGAIKGGIRGAAIYGLTNFTATPANIASAYVTAMFGIASQIQAYNRGEISSENFVINCETVCLDVSVSAVASLAGQLIIPIPVLGAVIGNVAGEFIYDICKKIGAERESQMIEGYQDEMKQLTDKLDIKYIKVVLEITKLLSAYKDLEKMAFDIDVNKAFMGSINLAKEVGVEDSKILKNRSQIDNYFLL